MRLLKRGTRFVVKLKTPIRVEGITRAILVLRGQRVILDRELAAIYGVRTGRLNEAVKRNAERFPEDFMFPAHRCGARELEIAICDLKLGRAPLSPIRLHRARCHSGRQRAQFPARYHDGSPRRACLRTAAGHPSLEQGPRAQARGARLLALDLKTQRQFKAVYEAIRALMNAPAPKRRGIGFTADLDGK